MKRILNHIFIDGLSGMASGLFATLIIGTILGQVGVYVGGTAGGYMIFIASAAKALTGAGIGVGIACKYQAPILVAASAAVAGTVGAYAGRMIDGSFLADGSVVLAGAGDPLGAFIASVAAVEIGILISGRTGLDIVLTPVSVIAAGSAVGIAVGPPCSALMTYLGELIILGHGTAAVSYGNRRSRRHGNASDTPHQFCGFRRHARAGRDFRRSGYRRMCGEYDRFCGSQFP